MTKYKCIKRLVVPELVGYEDEATGNDFIVEVGEIWNKENEDSYMLTRFDWYWLDIGNDTLEEHFEKMED